ncbi:heterokaryon incompatibility protein-domain-containing protein [Schizothecium vesticola]|uniref:Heterokaryon incompatibility protein-domain-containing protein n=1 Tax=Schizothecium vesticola TaxID=314040 RepID=A0AA40K5V2_9PEZI|nr:heterokaryon incompatibility protein-domain-containing protein [Schizothecium vesticola]
MMEPFKYHQVPFQDACKEIRLLSLSPSPTWSSPLQCRLSTTALADSSHPFTALSYVWGAATTTPQSIQITTASTNPASSTLPITTSLETALRYLRDPTSPTTLWIDQICINQGDPTEKAIQVGLMGTVYAAATQVLVWLGPAAHGSDLVMDAWAAMGREARAWGMEGYFTRERHGLLEGMVYGAEGVGGEEGRALQGVLERAADLCAPLLRVGMVKAWFEREWFTRVWVVQEFCLCADTVFVCGDRRVAAPLVRMAVQVLRYAVSKKFAVLSVPAVPMERLDEVSRESTGGLFMVRARREKFARGEAGGDGDRLHVLLRKLFVGHDARATEPRDRIYGLLGLAVDSGELGIRPNYTPGETSRSLTEAARAIVEKGARVDILCYSQFPKDVRSLPSWVPDWRPNLRRSYYTITETAEPHLYAASGDSAVEIVAPPGDNDRVLGLRGYLVDTIERVAEEAWVDMDWNHDRYRRYFDQFDALHRMSLEKGPPIHSQVRKKESRWRVPIGDIYWTKEVQSHRATPDVAVEHARCVQTVHEFEEMALLDGTELDERLAAWFERFHAGLIGASYRESMAIMVGKRPFLTRDGYLGMAPAEAEPGDVVIIFGGGRIPFVLRPTDVDESTFSFVGEAYCDGVMDGEIMEKTLKRSFFLD